MDSLKDMLLSYSRSGVYPFHMPGHKRRELPFANPYTIDITEIDGFDNLHHAEGILKEAQERASSLYGSRRCYALVNGSTCGLLAAVCAATKKGDAVLVARNCHKAVYHALFLQELRVTYLYPVITSNDLQGQITAAQVEEALRRDPKIAAVILTSPTYEGVVSDIAGIARIAHAYDVPLIVDSAHGAHFGFGGGFPESAVRRGADAVVMSLHKTLPSFTQTALLHLVSDRIRAEDVERYLGIFETSSPSYLLLAGTDACIRLLAEQGDELFSVYRHRLEAFYEQTRDLRYLHVLCRNDWQEGEVYDWDDGKLVTASPFTGKTLHRKLLEQYRLQMEMVSAHYVLGMTSIMDTEEGFSRLAAALHAIDAEASDEQDENVRYLRSRRQGEGFTARMYRSRLREMEIHRAMAFTSREVPFAEAEGRISADYVFLYPPGIPLLVPGEFIDGEFLEQIRSCQEMGLSVEGQANLSAGRIKIVYF